MPIEAVMAQNVTGENQNNDKSESSESDASASKGIGNQLDVCVKVKLWGNVDFDSMNNPAGVSPHTVRELLKAAVTIR